MCILTGLFSVGKKELFLPKETSEDVDTMPLDMELVNNLLFPHLKSILKLCYSTSSLTYQNFSLLGLWSTAAKGRIRSMLCNFCQFTGKISTIERILGLVLLSQ